MKKEIADKWVEALRSGKYEQTEGYLKTENGHCCLGVLCEISDLDLTVTERTPTFKPFKYFEFNNNDSHLPNEVKDWAGMKSVDGNLNTLYLDRDTNKLFSHEELLQNYRKENDISDEISNSELEWEDGFYDYIDTYYSFDNLAEINDAGYKFEFIAGIIEKNWEHL